MLPVFDFSEDRYELENHGQINHKSVISNIQDPEARGTMIFAWWMACLADAYGSAYYRRKPQVDDGDYDVDFYIVDPVVVDPDGQNKPGPREQLEVRPVFTLSIWVVPTYFSLVGIGMSFLVLDSPMI